MHTPEHHHHADGIFRGVGSAEPCARCIMEHAAPRLLEACKAALSQIEDYFNETIPADIDGARPRMAIEKKLRATIAAAEGRELCIKERQ